MQIRSGVLFIIGDLNINNNPWLNDEILECIHEKNRAWKRAKRSKDPDDIATAKRLRNDCKATIRRAKGNFVQDYLENDIISLKTFLEKINYLLPSFSSGNSIQLIDKGNNTPVTVEQTPNFIISIGHIILTYKTTTTLGCCPLV